MLNDGEKSNFVVVQSVNDYRIGKNIQASKCKLWKKQINEGCFLSVRNLVPEALDLDPGFCSWVSKFPFQKAVKGLSVSNPN